LEINGNGQAGGAISRIGWGSMRETLLSRHCVKNHHGVSKGGTSQDLTFFCGAANDVPFPIISSCLENSPRIVCRGSRHGRVKFSRRSRFLVRVRLKN
jgi:hypothetical protein